MARIGKVDSLVGFDVLEPGAEGVAPTRPAAPVGPVDLVGNLGALGAVLTQFDGFSSTMLGDLIEAAMFDAEEWLKVTRELGPPPPEAPATAAPAAAPIPRLGAQGDPQGAVLSQLSKRYETARLGDPTSTRSIKQAGCLLTSLTQSANELTGSSHDLVSANAAMVASGSFKGADLDLRKGAQAVGLTVEWRAALPARPSANQEPSAITHAKQALETRQARVIAGVDYKKGGNSALSAADHFVMIDGYDRDSDSFRGRDPAGGRALTFTRQFDGSYAAGSYKITEMAMVSAAGATPKLPPRRITG